MADLRKLKLPQLVRTTSDPDIRIKAPSWPGVPAISDMSAEQLQSLIDMPSPLLEIRKLLDQQKLKSYALRHNLLLISKN